MAVLSDADRKKLWAEFMSISSARRDSLPLKKAELRDALDAMDVWIDSNQAGFNAAIPLPARTALTVKQKTEMFMFVVRGRFEVA